MNTFNIIDLSDRKTIVNAFKTCSFCYLPCDSEDKMLISEIFDYMIKYYNQSKDIKNNLKINNEGIGYAEDGEITFDKKISFRHESFTYKKNKIDNHPQEKLFEKYINKINEYTECIFKSLIHPLFPNDEETKEYFSKITSDCGSLTMSHYINVQSDIKKGVVGLSEHTDWGFVTILYTQKEGLEIKVNNEWIRIPVKSDHFIVNIADMVEILSDGIYKSTLHRVMINYDEHDENKDKYSLIYFYDPNTKFISKPYNGSLSTYKPIRYDKYIKQKIYASQKSLESS
jgi:isopenicillin N synthase-like dioxygenase